MPSVNDISIVRVVDPNLVMWLIDPCPKPLSVVSRCTPNRQLQDKFSSHTALQPGLWKVTPAIGMCPDETMPDAPRSLELQFSCEEGISENQ